MNKTFLCGRLTREVHYSVLKDDTRVANYTLAVPIRGKKDKADFIPCTAFNDAADFARDYFKKGMRVLVEAHIKQNNYDRKDGIKVFSLEVVVENQYFADGTGRYGVIEDGLFAVVDDADIQSV